MAGEDFGVGVRPRSLPGPAVLRPVPPDVTMLGRSPKRPGFASWRRGGLIARAIQSLLGAHQVPDIEQWAASGLSLARYLEPEIPVASASGNLTQDRYNFRFLDAAVLADAVANIQTSAETCFLVRNIFMRKIGSGLGTGRGSFEFRTTGGTTRGTILSTSDSGAESNIWYEDEIWIPPNTRFSAVIDYTGPGGAGNEMSFEAGFAVYQYPAGVFPLCC